MWQLLLPLAQALLSSNKQKKAQQGQDTSGSNALESLLGMIGKTDLRGTQQGTLAQSAQNIGATPAAAYQPAGMLARQMPIGQLAAPTALSVPPPSTAGLVYRGGGMQLGPRPQLNYGGQLDPQLRFQMEQNFGQGWGGPQGYAGP